MNTVMIEMMIMANELYLKTMEHEIHDTKSFK